MLASVRAGSPMRKDRATAPVPDTDAARESREPPGIGLVSSGQGFGGVEPADGLIRSGTGPDGVAWIVILGFFFSGLVS
jgi:hypothetical protein